MVQKNALAANAIQTTTINNTLHDFRFLVNLPFFSEIAYSMLDRVFQN